MKKCAIFLLLALLMITMMGCSREETTYERTVNGETYVIDSKNQTLTHEGAVYTYTITEKSSKEYIRFGLLRVQYPDGTWYEREIDSDGNLGLSYEKTSSNYDEKTYPRGEDLCYALEKEALRAAGAEDDKDSGENTAMIVVAIFLAGVGAFLLLFPEAAHHLNYGLWVKDAEPTEFALGYTRFAGVVLIAICIGVLLFLR